jgi:hypothetical protein
MYSDKPILVTGCARSGTSLTAGILEICGAYGGKICGATKYNKKGQFENTEIRNNIVKPYLKKNNWDPLCQDPLPPRHLDPVPDWKEKILGVVRKHGYKGDCPWYYKGAKMCLMWQLWHDAFPKATWIIVRRNAQEIANSCIKTAFMRRRKTFESWIEWVNIHEQRFDDMEKAGLFAFNVYPSELINDQLDNMEKIVTYLGLTWNEEKVKEFIEPKLWNG